MDVAGLDRQRTAVRHGVTCVDRQVENRAFELVRIAPGVPQAGRRDDLERDGFAQGPTEQLLHGAHQAVGVHGLRIDGLAAGERQQPVRQGRGAIGGRRRRIGEPLHISGPALP